MNGAEPGLRRAQLRLKAVTHWPALPNLDAHQTSGGRDKIQGVHVGRGSRKNLVEGSTECCHNVLSDVSDINVLGS